LHVKYLYIVSYRWHRIVHYQTIATVDWCCCDFTVIMAPYTIGFTYLLTYLLNQSKRKNRGPHIVSLLYTHTQPLVIIAQPWSWYSLYRLTWRV